MKLNIYKEVYYLLHHLLYAMIIWVEWPSKDTLFWFVGMQVGKRMWLCTFDPKTDGSFDTRDSQKFKEFLQDKYERKKWWVWSSLMLKLYYVSDFNYESILHHLEVLIEHILIFRHFSKSKGRRDVEPLWSTGVQAPAQTQPPSGHPLNPAARPSRALVREIDRKNLR